MSALTAMFIGPDDADTCDGCEDAVNGNPYTIDTVPEPGSFECMNRCRHMVQLDESASDEEAPYVWHGRIGFTTDDSRMQHVRSKSTTRDEDGEQDEEEIGDDRATPKYYGDVEPDEDEASPDTGNVLGLDDESPDEDTPGYHAIDDRQYTTLDDTPGYTPAQDQQSNANDANDDEGDFDNPLNSEDFLDSVSEVLFGQIADLISVDKLAAEEADALAGYLFDAGLDVNDVLAITSYDAADQAAIRAAYAEISGDKIDEDFIHQQLINGNTDMLIALRATDPDTTGAIMAAMGRNGFDNADAESAFALGDVMGIKPKLNDEDGRWYVV